MAEWRCDDGNAEVVIEAPDAEEAAREYVDGGEWGDERSRTSWIHVHVWPVDSDRLDAQCITVPLDPPELPCDGPDHAWESPYELLGGMKENPGVTGHGGGVVITEACAHCACYRITDTWAQDPDTGRQGLKSLEYRPADARSSRWVAQREHREGTPTPHMQDIVPAIDATRER